MKLTREELLQKVELAPTDKVSGFWLCPEYKAEKQASEWYGGTVLSYFWDGRYEIRVRALGDNRGDIYAIDRDNKTIKFLEDYKDKNNAGVLGELLEYYDVNSDDEFAITCNYIDSMTAEDIAQLIDDNPKAKVLVVEQNNNWFELEICDRETNEFLTDNLCMDTLSYIEDGIDFNWIEEIFKNFKDEGIIEEDD